VVLAAEETPGAMKRVAVRIALSSSVVGRSTSLPVQKGTMVSRDGTVTRALEF
jgi:hypothetical protein